MNREPKSEQVEIRGTKWKLCSDGVWRTDKEFWGTPITDAIEEVIALRKRIAEVESDRDGNLTLAVWAKEGGYALKLRYDNGGVVVTIVSHDGETFRDVATMTVEAYRCRRVADFFLGTLPPLPGPEVFK